MSEANVEAQLRTRAFARVLGPYVAIFTTVLAIRLPDMTDLIDNLFANAASVWILGAVMLAGGLVIIGGHRSWRGPAAIAVSLFGWFVGLRGLGLIATTSAVRSATELSSGALTAARIFFALLALGGLWLTYVGWFTKPTITPSTKQS
ncbi:hypothetical protein [Micromonospora sp. NPDC050495]|uniref:hypothetical protein n=1 Tax=Micromonospora sp. NPDC050495 TaxID=3154936 RepID=UPI0033D92C2B